MADIGNEIAPHLLQIALRCHVEKDGHDLTVTHSLDAHIEFHRHAGLQRIGKRAGGCAAGDKIGDIVSRDHLCQLLADQPFPQKPDRRRICRNQGAIRIGHKKPVIEHLPNRAEHPGRGDRGCIPCGVHLWLSAVRPGDRGPACIPRACIPRAFILQI